MKIHRSTLIRRHADLLQKIGQDVVKGALRPEQRAQLEQAVQALDIDEVVSLCTLERLRLADDLKPHLLQMTLARKLGPEIAATLTNGEGLGAGINALAQSSGQPEVDIEAKLEAFCADLEGPGLAVQQESGFCIQRAPKLEARGPDEFRVVSDAPVSSRSGFEGSIRRGADGWILHLETVHAEHYDGPMNIPLADLPRDALLELHSRASAALAKDVDELITEKNGALGLYAPHHPMFSVADQQRDPNKVTSIEVRSTGAGPSGDFNEGDFTRGEDGQWTLELRAPQHTPTGPKSTYAMSELPTAMLLDMEYSLARKVDQDRYDSTISGVAPLLEPVRAELEARRTKVEDKLRTHLDGQLVGRTGLESLVALAKRVLDATGLSPAARLDRAGRDASSACDELADALTVVPGQAGMSPSAALAKATAALRTLSKLDTKALNSNLAFLVENHAALALGTLDRIKAPLRGNAKDVARLAEFGDLASKIVAGREGAFGDPALLERVQVDGWAEARVDVRTFDRRSTDRFAEAKASVDHATERLSQILVVARGQSKSAQSAMSAMWVDAMDAVETAATTLRAAEAGSPADRKVDPHLLGELSGSLSGFRRALQNLLKHQPTTKARYAEAIADANYLAQLRLGR